MKKTVQVYIRDIGPQELVGPVSTIPDRLAHKGFDSLTLVEYRFDHPPQSRYHLYGYREETDKEYQTRTENETKAKEERRKLYEELSKEFQNLTK